MMPHWLSRQDTLGSPRHQCGRLRTPGTLGASQNGNRNAASPRGFYAATSNDSEGTSKASNPNSTQRASTTDYDNNDDDSTDGHDYNRPALQGTYHGFMRWSTKESIQKARG